MPKRQPLVAKERDLSDISFNMVTASSQRGVFLEEARALPLSEIVPNESQFRQTFDPNTIRELANSIAEQGLIEPIIVRQVGDKFQVVAGARRLLALRLLQQENNPRALAKVPALIRVLDDTEAALIIAAENLQREDLNIADEAVMYERLIKALGLDPERGGRELARRLGIERHRIQRVRKIAQHPSYVARINSGELTLRRALDLLQEEEQAPEAEADENAELAHMGPSSTNVESSPPLFSEQHVAEYTRRVPTAAIKPWISARTFFNKWSQHQGQVIEALPLTELDVMEREAMEVREQLEKTILLIRQARATNGEVTEMEP